MIHIYIYIFRILQLLVLRAATVTFESLFECDVRCHSLCQVPWSTVLDCPEALMFLRLLEGAFEAMPQTIVQGIVLYEDRP